MSRAHAPRQVAEDELAEAVFLVYANKQDLPRAMGVAEISEALGLSALRAKRWFIQPSLRVWVLRGPAVASRAGRGIGEFAD